LAGPVFAAAVILPNFDLSDLCINDSKQLSHSQREQIFEKLLTLSTQQLNKSTNQQFLNTQYSILNTQQINKSTNQRINSYMFYGIGVIDHLKIDEINILQATYLAMEQAINSLNIKPHHLLIDGNRFKDIGIPYTTIINGDAKCLSIAAASIIAKISRDRWMLEVADKQYPEYGFAQHKGYGTKSHYEAIDKFGICPIHRKSFLKRYLEREYKMF
jgi:ribonuclease HII